MCITPLSIEIAFSKRSAKAVTKAGEEILELISGKRALGIFDLISSINAILFFSMKNKDFIFFYNFLS